jgi:2-desacetyl-2-hydroxyethyl bacteriochlorophyllide A dehydrogenase
VKGVIFSGDRGLEIVDLPKPRPGSGEVLVEMKASGVCGSDLRRYRRSAGEIPERERRLVRGHEPCGVVVEVGAGARNIRVGDRVMIYHYKGCGHCKHCRAGWEHLCLNGFDTYGMSGLDGGHQDYLLCHDAACVPMPDGLGFEEGACCACGTGTAYQALRRLAVSGLDTLAIFGQGPVGASGTMLAKAMGARVIAVDTAAERLELAREVGADEVVDASREDAVAVIKEMTGGEGAEATMDCTGAEVARVNCLLAAKVWGRVAFVGEHGKATFDMTPQIIHKQLTIHGSWTLSAGLLAEVGQFVVDRKVPLKNLISHRFPLARAAEAYELFDAGRTWKVVFTW